MKTALRAFISLLLSTGTVSAAIPEGMVGNWVGGVSDAIYAIEPDGSFKVRRLGSHFLVNDGVIDATVSADGGLEGMIHYRDGDQCAVKIRLVGATMVWSALPDFDGSNLACSKTLRRSSYVPPQPRRR